MFLFGRWFVRRRTHDAVCQAWRDECNDIRKAWSKEYDHVVREREALKRALENREAEHDAYRLEVSNDLIQKIDHLAELQHENDHLKVEVNAAQAAAEDADLARKEIEQYARSLREHCDKLEKKKRPKAKRRKKV